jgi:hypothetical protein
MIFLGTLNENDNFMFCVLASGRKVTIFRTLTVAPSVGVFSKLAMKRTKPIIVLHHKLYSVEITYLWNKFSNFKTDDICRKR